jgi:hypothetical protein
MGNGVDFLGNWVFGRYWINLWDDDYILGHGYFYGDSSGALMEKIMFQ